MFENGENLWYYGIRIILGVKSLVRRLFVEKKQGFDVEAQSIHSDLCDSLGLDRDV